MKRVVIEAPASSANLGPGFDTFAVALRSPRDRLVLERGGRDLTLEVNGQGMLSDPTRKDVIGPVVNAILSDNGIRSGVRMRLSKSVPVGVGLGSSAALSVASAVGISQLFHLDLPSTDLIRYAGLGEKVAAGAAHYDNVTASYAGGFVIVTDGYGYVRMEPSGDFALCFVIPDVRLPKNKTMWARAHLPKGISLKKMVYVARAASIMVHGFATGSVEEIGKAMAVSPVDSARAKMIPRFNDAKKAALVSGAAGVCISGSGPTLLAITEKRVSQLVLKEMIRAFRTGGVESKGFATEIGEGCRVLEE